MHSDQKKIDAVTAYLVLGKASLAEAATKVPAGTIRRWKMEPWWDDLVSQIQTEDDLELDAKLAKRLNKALDVIDDRLESGDFMFDPKTGEFRRRPVTMRDTWRVTKDLIDARQVLRTRPKAQASNDAVAGILKDLAQEFATIARKRIHEKPIEGEVVDAEFTDLAHKGDQVNAKFPELRPGLQTGSTDGKPKAEVSPQTSETGPVQDGESRAGTA